MIRKVPDAIESFQDIAAKLLMDRHHGVLLTGVALMMEICAVDPAAIEAYRKHVPQLCNIMRSLLVSGFAPEHDVSGITDPFLQVKVSFKQYMSRVIDCKASCLLRFIIPQLCRIMHALVTSSSALKSDAASTTPSCKSA